MSERLADVVIDVGCANHGGDRSVVPLVERFHPRVLVGFDMQQGDDWWPHETIDGTEVLRVQAAAWVRNEDLSVWGSSLGARVVPLSDDSDSDFDTRGFDIANVIEAFAGRVVLKLDAESAEWEIIPHLVERGIDERLALILVEWHCLRCGHGGWSHAAGCEGRDETEERARAIEATVRCPIERWEL